MNKYTDEFVCSKVHKLSIICMCIKVKVMEKHRFSPVFVSFAVNMLFVYISN